MGPRQLVLGNLYKRLGYENECVRVGLIHYNTAEEVDRLVGELTALGAR